MSPRSVVVLDREALEAMPTRQLLARLKALQRCEDDPRLSDWSAQELAQTEGIVFKLTEAWQRAHTDVTAVLAGREHVPRGPERRQARAQRAAQGRRAGRRDRR